MGANGGSGGAAWEQSLKCCLQLYIIVRYILSCVRLPSSNIRTKALLSDKFVVVLDSI